MTNDAPQSDPDIDEPDPEDFGFDENDAESDLEFDRVDETQSADAARLRPPPIDWTFRSVLVTALVFALVGFTVGYFVAKPRPPGENSVDVGFMRDMIDITTKPSRWRCTRSPATPTARRRRWPATFCCRSAKRSA